jgi:hypothetical protein
MLVTKLVIRMLDVDEQLLGWAEVQAEARGDGKLWVDPPTFVAIERDGVVNYLSVHWCDVNVEIRSVVERARVTLGQLFELPGQWAAITCGPAAGGLPSVTVRSPVAVQVPVGAFGAKG